MDIFSGHLLQSRLAAGNLGGESMKIYIATSWKMESVAKIVAETLKNDGHYVDCFCDSVSGRYVFHWTELVEKEEDLKNYNAISFLNDPRTKKAFDEDKMWIDWADAVVMLHPCGKSAHLEAGYAKGQGKLLFMWGKWPKGEFDVMYGFADMIFDEDELGKLRDVLKRYL